MPCLPRARTVELLTDKLPLATLLTTERRVKGRQFQLYSLVATRPFHAVIFQHTNPVKSVGQRKSRAEREKEEEVVASVEGRETEEERVAGIEGDIKEDESEESSVGSVQSGGELENEDENEEESENGSTTQARGISKKEKEKEKKESSKEEGKQSGTTTKTVQTEKAEKEEQACTGEQGRGKGEKKQDKEGKSREPQRAADAEAEAEGETEESHVYLLLSRDECREDPRDREGPCGFLDFHSGSSPSCVRFPSPFAVLCPSLCVSKLSILFSRLFRCSRLSVLFVVTIVALGALRLSSCVLETELL